MILALVFTFAQEYIDEGENKEEDPRGEEMRSPLNSA